MADETVPAGICAWSRPHYVGRAQLPSDVLGLLFYAAEHACRHTGPCDTAKVLCGVTAL